MLQGVSLGLGINACGLPVNQPAEVQVQKRVLMVQRLPAHRTTCCTLGLQVSGISSLLVDLRSGLKKVRTTILEPAEQQSDLLPADKVALDAMTAFHKNSRTCFMELEVSTPASHCA